MANAEDLARWVAANTPGRGEITGDERRMVPPVPKPGEVIICQECGKPMYPQDFSKDPKIRKHEFKWHMHWACEQHIWDVVDQQTPGLVAERSGGVNRAIQRNLFTDAETVDFVKRSRG